MRPPYRVSEGWRSIVISVLRRRSAPRSLDFLCYQTETAAAPATRSACTPPRSAPAEPPVVPWKPTASSHTSSAHEVRGWTNPALAPPVVNLQAPDLFQQRLRHSRSSGNRLCCHCQQRSSPNSTRHATSVRLTNESARSMALPVLAGSKIPLDLSIQRTLLSTHGH